MAKGDFRNARGVLPWKEGDELPEYQIRRLRDGGEEMGPYYYRKWVNAQADADRRRELLEAHEWVPQFKDHAPQFHFCPECRQIRQDGHADVCMLKKELADETR